MQLEIQRHRKHPIAYIEKDASGCYDRIVNPLVLLFLKKNRGTTDSSGIPT